MNNLIPWQVFHSCNSVTVFFLNWDLDDHEVMKGWDFPLIVFHGNSQDSVSLLEYYCSLIMRGTFSPLQNEVTDNIWR